MSVPAEQATDAWAKKLRVRTWSLIEVTTATGTSISIALHEPLTLAFGKRGPGGGGVHVYSIADMEMIEAVLRGAIALNLIPGSSREELSLTDAASETEQAEALTLLETTVRRQLGVAVEMCCEGEPSDHQFMVSTMHDSKAVVGFGPTLRLALADTVRQLP